MLVPRARGDLTAHLADLLRGAGDDPHAQAPGPTDLDDAALALWILYGLHYHGYHGVDDRREWDPHLLTIRARLEADLEARLRTRFPGMEVEGDLAEAIFDVIDKFEGVSLATFVHREATADQVLRLLRVRSLYHLREADPTSWTVPRLIGPAKAGLAEVQYDEYGAGRAENLHAALFARGMVDAGLDPAYGAYVDEAPAEVLEQNNVMSLFGLHRRLRAAAMGHLAAFEATSSQPARRMAQGLRRLAMPESLVGYYTEHVEADAVHEQLVVRSICVPLVESEPRLLDDLFFGIFTCLDQEDRVGRRMLAEWDASDQVRR